MSNKRDPIEKNPKATRTEYLCPECKTIIGVRHGDSKCVMETCAYCKTEINTKGINK